MDRDGDLDFVTANFGDGNISIFFGNGDGTFQAQLTIATLADPRTSASGDLNDDGILDLVIAHATDNVVSVLLGAP